MTHFHTIGTIHFVVVVFYVLAPLPSSSFSFGLVANIFRALSPPSEMECKKENVQSDPKFGITSKRTIKYHGLP